MREMASLQRKRQPPELRIFDAPRLSRLRPESMRNLELVAHISIGAGETHVTLLDPEGRDIQGWTAVFGWARLAVRIDDNRSGDGILLTNEEMIAEALTGTIRKSPGRIDTTRFVECAISILTDGLREIISRTFGGTIEVSSVILAGPEWLHGAIQCCLCLLREDISPEIVLLP